MRAVLQIVGETVRQIRVERGMTQEQLAHLADMHRSFIISIEKGRQNASVITLTRLATALRVLPSDLLRGVTKSVMRNLPSN